MAKKTLAACLLSFGLLAAGAECDSALAMAVSGSVALGCMVAFWSIARTIDVDE